MSELSRRDAIAAASLSMLTPPAFAQTDTASPRDLDDVSATLSRFPRTDFLRTLRRTKAGVKKADARFEAVTDAASAGAFAASAREDARACLLLRDIVAPEGPPPSEIVGSIERPDFRIDRVIYDSLPGYRVTASLYVPTGERASESMPAVVGLCGHASEGKARDDYQRFAIGLASAGFVVLLLDPIGQGERLIEPAEDENGRWRSRLGGATTQHIKLGNRLGLTGNFFGGLRLLDGIRAIDLLVSRDDVDSERIGVTGNSGGGTMTTWLTAVDDRVAFSAPSCFVTSFLSNLENELPADSEQCPPGALARGLDHAGFLAANAPKPLLICAQRFDFFDIRGTRKAFGQLQSLYRAMGAEDAVQLHVGEGTHGVHRDAREAMVRLFAGAAGLGKFAGDDWTEPDIGILTAAELNCFDGRPAEANGSRSPLDLIDDLLGRRGDARPDAVPERLTPAVDVAVAGVRVLRTVRGAKPRPYLGRYHVTASTGPTAIVYRAGATPIYAIPSGQTGLARLLVAVRSSHRELQDAEQLASLMANEGAAIYAVDLPGTGELQPRVADAGSIDSIYGSDYMLAAYGEMNDRPMIRQRAEALMAAIEWIRSLGHSQLEFVAPDAEGDLARLTLNHYLGTMLRDDAAAKSNRDFYRETAASRDLGGSPPLSVLPFGVLD